MGPTLYLFTATFLAAQAPEIIPPKRTPPPAAVAPEIIPAPSSFDADCDCCEETGPIRGFWQRLRSGGLFHHGEDCGCEERVSLLDRLHSRVAGMFQRNDCDCGCADEAAPLPAPVAPAKTPILNRMPSGDATPQGGVLIIPPDQPMSRTVRPTPATAVWAPPESSARKPFRPFDGLFAKMKFLPSRSQSSLPTSTVILPARAEDRTVITAKPTGVRPVEAVTPIQYQPVASHNEAETIRPAFVGRVGHEADYSGITGQLQRVNGRWVLHYAAAGSGDRFGGRLVLASDRDLSQFRDGDLVAVRGGILNAAQGQATMYLAMSIQLVQR